MTLLHSTQSRSNEDIIIEKIAEVAHETNRAYCATFMNDYSQEAWHEASKIIKDSAIAGVKFHVDNPGALSRDFHESWLKYKEAEGWVYGEVKDIEKKTHPCMVPFDDLPQGLQVKDLLFYSIVSALIDEYLN